MTSYYVVHKGKKPGIYKTWNECKNQIDHFEGALFKKFCNKIDAENFLKNGFGENHKPKSLVRKENDDIRNDEKIEKELEDSDNKIFIYTDGSCIKFKNNLSKAGYGIYIPSKNIKVAAPLLYQKITNNRAELTAIIKSIEYLDENELLKRICILTDSQYSMYLFNGTGERYEQNNYKMDGKDVPNIDLIKKLLEIKNNYNIVLLKIRAHTNKKDIHSIGNNIADKLANEGATQEPDKNNFFKDKPDKNNFFKEESDKNNFFKDESDKNNFSKDESDKNNFFKDETNKNNIFKEETNYKINTNIQMNELFEASEGKIKNLKNQKLSKWFVKEI